MCIYSIFNELHSTSKSLLFKVLDNKYYFSKHTVPWATAPTTTVIGSSLGTRSLGFTKLGAENEVPSLRQPTGR